MSINTKLYIEEYLKIRDKKSRVIPFKLNEPQIKLYNTIRKLKQEGKPVRILVLKARQMGFSTLTEAILFKEVVTKSNVTAGIITHESKATNNLFNMSKLYYDNLPEAIKPSIMNRNAQELIFNTKDNSGLNSKITCMTAGNGAGRSGTYNFLHLSEFAFWEGDKKEAYISLMQTVPNTPDSMAIIESTANGYEYFKELWDKAVNKETDFIPFFVGWNELQEYQIPYTGFELTNEEKELKRIYNLSLDQLEWRRWCIRNNCGGDIQVFKQEYPINPEEAFISTGKCYFDKETLIKRIEEIRNVKSKKQGYFDFDYDGLKISNIRWIEDKEGPIKIYEEPKKGYPYVLSGDTSGEGSDYFIGQVLDNTTGKQVAVLRQEYDEISYTRQMYCLGMYYNTALIGIEANYSTYPIEELERLKYPKQYIRHREDTYTGKTTKSYGFKTTSISRPRILGQLQTIFKESIELIVDEETLKEGLTFIKNEKGRPEAQVGYHDDLIMALAIAYDIREQQDMKAKTERQIKQDNMYKDFGIEEDIKEDYGSTIEII